MNSNQMDFNQVHLNAPPSKVELMKIKKMSKRREVTRIIYPLNTRSFKCGDRFEMRLRDNGYVDLSRSYFQYKVKGKNSVANTTLQLTPFAESLFRRISIRSGNGVELEQEFNNRDVLFNFLARYTMSRDALTADKGVQNNVAYDGSGAHGSLRGARTLDRAANNDDQVLGPFVTSSNIGFMNMRMLPMQHIGELTLSVELVPLLSFCESFVTATGVPAADTEDLTIEEVQFVYVSEYYGDEFDAHVAEKVNSESGLDLIYDTYENKVDNMEAGSGTLQSNIIVSSTSLKTLITIPRHRDGIDKITGVPPTGTNDGFVAGGHNYRFAWGVGVNDSVPPGDKGYYYQYDVVGNLYPQTPAYIVESGYQELRKALGLFGDVGKGSVVQRMNGIGVNSYIGSGGSGVSAAGDGWGTYGGSLGFAQNFEELHEPGVNLSGINTTSSPSLVFKLTRGGGAAIRLDHFAHVDRVLKIKAGLEVSVHT